MAEAAATRTLEELAPGARSAFAFSISADQMRQFAELSGDHNPLHCETAFAAARHHPGVVVYGGLLVAQVSRLIGMQLPGRDALWTGLDIDFVRPLYVGERAELEAEVTHLSTAVRALELRFRIRRSDQTIAKGTAQVSLAA